MHCQVQGIQPQAVKKRSNIAGQVQGMCQQAVEKGGNTAVHVQAPVRKMQPQVLQ